MLDSGKCESRAELARKLGVSRVRVTQVLNLLNIYPKILIRLQELGDPLDGQIVTERKLREIEGVPFRKQLNEIEKMVSLVFDKRQ